jgi:DNA invertase Pin-like site-specific DNA recombinase
VEGVFDMKYGYARVSTRGQDLTSQIQALTAEGCEMIFQEKFTGTTKERAEFEKVIAILKKGDTLVVTKLDRFARSSMDALSTIKELFDKGVRVHVLNMGVIEDTPTGTLVFTIMSAFAQFERDLIVQRTQEGKEVAKQSPDFKEGRPKKFNKVQIEHALTLLRDHSYTQVEEMTGISVSTLLRAKRKATSK